MQYEYNNIPKEFEITIYTHYCYHSNYSWKIGNISHYDSDLSGNEYICIAQTPVAVTVPPQTTDMVIDALEAEKKKQMAEYHKKMFELQEKIDSLLCLEYKPATEDF